MIPNGLTDEHFLSAAKEIDINGVPNERASVHYDLVITGRKYPPKYVISISARYFDGEEWPSQNFDAVEAKNYFIKRGYKVVDRREGIKVQKISPEDDESSFPEGKEKYREHSIRERDGQLSKKAKEARLKKTGTLRCEVCRFDFTDTYGEIGSGFIEAHHTIPVSELNGERKTKLEELALVCSNCHRMLHRSNPVLSIEQLRAIIVKQEEIQ